MAETNPNPTPQATPQSTPQPDAETPKTNGATLAWDGTLVLRKAVVANGETVMQLKFREPTGGDIERIGNPVTMGVFEQQPKVHFESAIMTQMMAHLAGVPPSTIRSMHPRDWTTGAWMLVNFFIPDL